MSINQLYQATIIAHNKSPRHFGVLSDATHVARGKNPLCGDDYTLYLKVVDGIIIDAQFHGDGCAISKSSGSLMTDQIIGLDSHAFLSLSDHFLSMLTTDAQINKQILGKLAVFEGVRDYPVRVKCATLVWHAGKAAIKNRDNNTVSTE